MAKLSLHVLAPVALLVGATACTQPEMNCSTAQGSYAAKYTLIQGDPESECGQQLGDVLGVRTYFQAGGAHGTPDYTKAELAIRPESLGLMLAYAEARGVVDPDAVYHDANAIAPFTTGFPDDAGFCMADTFDPAHVSLPEIAALDDDPTTPDLDETQPAQPAIDVEYQWSDARFVVTPDAQGTQFEANLEIHQAGCQATYHVVGLYPVVACETEADCDDEQNGINPDFAVRCDTELGLCVLDGELPAYE